MNVPDNYDLWRQHEQEQQRLLDKCLICEDRRCRKPIQDDYFFEIDGEILCEKCMTRRYRRNVEDCYERKQGF